MYPTNWQCPHCEVQINTLGKDHHLAQCEKNPANLHRIDIYYADGSVYKWNIEVYGPKEMDALQHPAPTGGYVKLHVKRNFDDEDYAPQKPLVVPRVPPDPSKMPRWR